ncbi:MAG: GNAT family N-acetyltransferase [Anaerolineae bacterium]|nr:GNAT family N-acetyltransferase [Anaerolineae bacterium]
MLRIDGERIYLRDHRAGDLESFHAWLSDPVVARYLTFRTSTRDQSFIQLADALQENDKETRTKYFFATVLHENDHIIGEAGFTIKARAEHGGIADLGYFLLKPYWGKGYATEATELMLAYCFKVLKLHKVVATCDAENKASERVMKRCGMVQEACPKKDYLLNGEWRDRLGYGILYEDWIKHQEPMDGS